MFLLRIQLFGLLQAVEFILFSVHFTEVEQVFFIPSLRNEKLRVLQFPRHLHRNDNLLGLAMKAFANFGNRRDEQFLVRFVQLALVFKGETLVDGAVLDVYVVDIGVFTAVVVHDGEDVDVVDRVAHHLALRHKFVQQDILPLQFLSPLELQQLRVFHHFFVEPLAHLPRVALQNLPCLPHILLIVLVALLVDAGRAAVVDVVFQARPVLPCRHSLLRDGLSARARLVEFLDEFQYRVHAGDVGIRPEVGAEALVDGARLEDAGEILVRHADTGVGLAVLQQHVVARIVLLDEAVFEQQGVFLRVDDRITDVVNLRHQHLGLVSVHLFVEIRRHPSLQTLGRAHIYNNVVGVIELIATRLLRHVEHDVLEPSQPFFVFFFRQGVVGLWGCGVVGVLG